MTTPLLPGSTIGILGGGQLGRMLTLAARRMGYRTVSWIGGPDTGPAALSDLAIEEPFDSSPALNEFLAAVDVATVEFENIPRELLETISGRVPLHPNAEAITVCQHREREKLFLSKHGFPCAPFAVVDSVATLLPALAELPDSGGILKTAEFGYDGKGQLRVERGDDPSETWRQFDAPRAVLENRIELEKEVSVLVVRNAAGDAVSYDPVENIHRDHILDLSLVPASIEPSLLAQAEEVARAIAESLSYVGILAVEFFVDKGGELLVNEMAPRPHNSGHHTIDACESSQFEQQLRAICGLPLGSSRLHSPTAMLNLLGDVWIENEGSPDWSAVLSSPGTHLHLYGKKEAREGRKMGHLTVTAETGKAALEVQNHCREILGIPPLLRD